MLPKPLRLASITAQGLVFGGCLDAVLVEGTVGNVPSPPIPRDFHNLFVIIVAALVLAWAAKVVYQVLRAAELSARLARSQPLQLEGMSIYASDFQILIRQHFNQILRIRRTVPPKPVTRQALFVHIRPESIGMCSDDAGSATRTGARFGVQFTVDALVPCCVQVFWGVSVAACNDFVQKRMPPVQAGQEQPGWRRNGRGAEAGARGALEAGAGRGPRWARPRASVQESTRSLLDVEAADESTAPGRGGSDQGEGIFLPGQFWAQSRDFLLPAGSAQQYVTPAGDMMDPAQIPFDVSAPWLRDGHTAEGFAWSNLIGGFARMPMAIVVMAQNRPAADVGEVQGVPVVEAHGQLSFVKFRSRGEDGAGPRSPEIVRQLAFGDQAAVHEVHGVYGFEDEGEGDCMICYARPKNVLLLPCRHCSVCHPCLRALRDEKCPLCRSAFTSYVTFPINRTGTLSSSSVSRPTGPQPPDAPPPPPPEGPGAGPGAGPSAGGRPADGGGGCARGAICPEAANGAAASSASGAVPAFATGGAAASVGGAALRGGGAGGASAGPEGPQAQVEPVRQVRDVQLGRPRGSGAASRKTGQGLRMSGRARFLDRVDNADSPLLHDGVAASSQAPARPAETGEIELDTRREHVQTDETRTLIQDSEVV